MNFRCKAPLFFIFTSLLVWTNGCATLIDKSEKNKEKSKIYLQLAADQFLQKDYPKAVESTQEALKYDPEYSAAFNHLGIIYMETKRYTKSEEAFRKALTLKTNYPEVYNNLGVLFNRQERFQDAIKELEKAIRFEGYLTPENAYTNLGYSYYRLGNQARAKLYHQKALDISPELCLAQKNLGDVYAKEKNFKKASEHFQRAVVTCPLYEESQYKLGLALMKLGQKSIAKSQFQKLIEQHKTGPYVERSQEVLRYLH